MTLILCVSCSASVSRAKPHPLCQGRDGHGAARSGPGPTSSAFSYASAQPAPRGPQAGSAGLTQGSSGGPRLAELQNQPTPEV